MAALITKDLLVVVIRLKPYIFEFEHLFSSFPSTHREYYTKDVIFTKQIICTFYDTK